MSGTVKHGPSGLDAGRGRMTATGRQRRGPAVGRLMAALFALVLAACTPLIADHGYVPSDKDLAQLVVGKDNRESVAATIGRPSASGLLNDEGWYYVASRFQTVGAAAPKEIDREVVAITFNDKGVVENIERFGLQDGRIVPISRRITTANVRGKSILAQLFGNIGKLNADSLFQ